MKFVFHNDTAGYKDSTGHKVLEKRAMISFRDSRAVIKSYLIGTFCSLGGTTIIHMTKYHHNDDKHRMGLASLASMSKLSL